MQFDLNGGKHVFWSIVGPARLNEELLEWRGPFDPEAFDAKKATREMRKVK